MLFRQPGQEVGFQLKALLHPSNEPARSVLSKRRSLFVLRNRGVRVGYDRRGEQHRRARGKFDDELQRPENQVPSLFGIEVAERGDRAQPKGHVSAVAMTVGDGPRSEIEGGGAPDAVGEVAPEGAVVIEQFVEVIFVVHV